ncbi:MAG: hypothetical protein ACLSVO_05165 [Alistipes sp.]|jgi:hypothetical protein|uniref:hypothetical protein n=1 Tax=Alistipes sp. TaxID=1872444 RepID=UPI0020582D26|nr:MAG TPA: hypothetical protein [Caudoviricetes sp.]
MFANLTKGSSVFVLDTRETPRCYRTVVKDISQPFTRPINPAQPNFMPPQLFVRITTENNDTWEVPNNMKWASKEGLTIAMEREDIVSQINAAKQDSIQVVNSYEQHKKNIERYEQILREFDPVYAAAIERDNEIQRLSEMVKGLTSQLSAIASKIDTNVPKDESKPLAAEKQASTKNK